MPRNSIPLYACEKDKRYATERIQKASDLKRIFATSQKKETFRVKKVSFFI
jgi:hypothetical protein